MPYEPSPAIDAIRQVIEAQDPEADTDNIIALRQALGDAQLAEASAEIDQLHNQIGNLEIELNDERTSFKRMSSDAEFYMLRLREICTHIGIETPSPGGAPIENWTENAELDAARPYAADLSPESLMAMKRSTLVQYIMWLRERMKSVESTIEAGDLARESISAETIMLRQFVSRLLSIERGRHFRPEVERLLDGFLAGSDVRLIHESSPGIPHDPENAAQVLPPEPSPEPHAPVSAPSAPNEGKPTSEPPSGAPEATQAEDEPILDWRDILER